MTSSFLERVWTGWESERTTPIPPGSVLMQISFPAALKKTGEPRTGSHKNWVGNIKPSFLACHRQPLEQSLEC